MMYSNKLFILFSILILALISCGKEKIKSHKIVEVKEIEDQYQLFRHGKPYYIQGAGGYTHFDKIKEYGGNSIRTWTSENADSILDEAHKHGLTVTLGLDLLSERHGFNYDDSKAIEAQFEKVKKTVLKHKDHPALLLWAIGNELNVYNPRTTNHNLKVWDAVNQIAKMIHQVDPNHPTTTVIVPYRRTIWQIKRRCPEIDILSINSFGNLGDIPDKIKEPIIGWNGPYIISEWGPLGWWEVERTIWDAPIEATTTKKAEFYLERYEVSMKKDKENCLGSYVFYWGQKQEKTPTWFSMFSKEGYITEPVHAMKYIWTGKYPTNKAPKIDHMLLNNKGAKENIFITSNSLCNAIIKTYDPDNDSLKIRWEILPDYSGQHAGGGDLEKIPMPLPGLFIEDKGPELSFNAPPKEGPYRLFVYVYDGKNNIASTNTPFFVIE